MLINSPNISGSLRVTGNTVITGSLTVAGGINATITGSATSASYVEYSNVANKPTLVSGSAQVSFNGITDKPALVSGSSQITYSGLSGIPSGIISSSTQITGYNIFATTGSNQFNGSQAITGSLTVTGQVVAQTLNVQQVTSSIVYSSGSNIFGNSLSNTQQFTGSMSVTGSLTVNGTGSFLTNSNGFVARFTGGATGGVLGGFFANSTTGFASIGVQSNHEFRIFTNDADRLTIAASTGAATFSNTVTATGNVRSINTGVDGTFADAFVGVYNVNNNEQNAIQTSVSSAANVSGFRFQASNGGGSAGRTTVVDFLRDRQIFYGNVGIGETNPSTKLNVVGAATQGQGLLNISNTHAGGSVYYPAAKIRNTRGDHSYGIISEFSIGSTGGTDRPSIIFYSDASTHSWNVGQVTAAWGTADSFGIGYRANNAPSTFADWPTNYFTITTGGNVGINNTSPTEGLVVARGALRVTSQALDFGAGTRGISIDTTGAGLGRIYTVSGTGTATDLAFGTNNTERMRITTGGNVGIGTASPSQRLQVENSSNAFIRTLNNAIANGTQSGIIVDSSWSGSDRGVTFAIYKHSSITNPASYISFYSGGSAFQYMYMDDSNIIRISSSSSDIGTSGGTIVGTQTSDIRLKNVKESFSYGLEDILKINPIAFTFKNDANNTDKLGFSAQEMINIIPESVYDTRNCVDGYEDTDDPMIKIPKSDDTILAMDYSILIPVLVKAIQEQQSQIEILKTKIEILEQS